MSILEIFIALTVSLLLCGVFALFARITRRKMNLSWSVLIIFLAAWAGGIWLRPFGPSLLGIYWLPFFSRTNSDKLDAIAEALLKNESLPKNEVDDIPGPEIFAHSEAKGFQSKIINDLS